MATRSTRSILGSLLRTPELNLQEPWYSYRSRDLAKVIGEGRESVGDKETKDQLRYGRELLTTQRFEASLQTPVTNAFSDKTIYTNKNIDKIGAIYDRKFSEVTKRFPDLTPDFTDTLESHKAKLETYRSLNTQYDIGVSNGIPDATAFLEDFTEILADFKWEDLTPDKNIEIKNKLLQGTQTIATLGKMMENNRDYFKYHETYNENYDKVNIGIIGTYNQLMTQLDTRDPDANILSKSDRNAALNSIRYRRPEEIININNKNVAFENKRLIDSSGEFDKSYDEWVQNDAYTKSPDYIKEYDTKMQAYKDYVAELDQKLSKDEINEQQFNDQRLAYWDNKDNWTSFVLLDNKGNALDVRTTPMRQAILEGKMDRIDSDYKNETGSKYSGWMNRPTPWREPPPPPSPREIRKEIIEKTGVTGLPEPGGVATPVGGEPLAVSKFHEPVSPEIPTMPTGVPVKAKEDSDKKLMQKHKLNPSQLDSLKDEHKYAISAGATQDLDSFLSSSLAPLLTEVSEDKPIIEDKPVSGDAQTVMDAYSKVHETGFSRSKEGDEFKKKYDLTGRQMALLNSLGNAYKASDSPNKKANITKKEKAFSKAYDPLGRIGVSLEKSREWYYNWYMIGMASRGGKKYTLDDKTKKEIEKQFPNIMYEKRVFQKIYPKKRDQNLSNLNAWKKRK